MSLCKRGQIWLWARVRRWRRIVWWQTSLQNAVRKLVAVWNQIWRVVLIIFAHLLDTMSLFLKGAWYYISLCYYEVDFLFLISMKGTGSTQSVLMPGLGFWIFDNMLWFWFRKLQKIINFTVLMNTWYFFPSYQKYSCEFSIFIHPVCIIGLAIRSSIRGIFLSSFWSNKKQFNVSSRYQNSIISDTFIAYWEKG